MAVLPYPKSNLDGQQALSYGFDDTTQSFRTTAAFSGTISISLAPATDGVYIGDNVSGNKMTVNADGSINTNVAIDHTSDSVRLGNGTSYLTSTTTGAKIGLDVAVTNNVQLFTKQYDTITVLYPSATTEEYKSRVGGISGTVQETVTVTYVDATKNDIVNVVRT